MMGSQQNIFSIGLIVIILFPDRYVECCSASDNKYWDNAKQKCLKCKTCREGQARDFENKYEGLNTTENGDLECLPCKDPPPGKYLFQTSKLYPPKFAVCKNCTRLRRETSVQCGHLSPYTDARCGKCVEGYIDPRDNTDYPCEVNSTEKNDEKAGSVFDQENATEKVTTNASSSKDGPVESNSISNVEIAIAAVTGGTFILTLTFGTAVIFRWRRRGRNKLSTNGHVNDVLLDNIETDGPTLAIGEKLANHGLTAAICDSNENLLPSPSLPGQEGSNNGTGSEAAGLDINRAQTSHQQKSQNRRRGSPLQQEKGNKYGDTICSCFFVGNCDCPDFDNPGFQNRILQPDEEILRIIAFEICHDTHELFIAIKLDINIYFQCLKDRERNIDGSTENEFIHRCLKRWVQSSGTNYTADLKTLFKGLHKAKFHDICVRNYDPTLLYDST